MPRVKVKLPKEKNKEFPWMNEEMKGFFVAALKTQNLRDQAKFFRDILTDNELRMLGLRWHIAEKLWQEEQTYEQIAEELETTTTTVTKIAKRLYFGEGGLELVLKILYPKKPDKDELEKDEMRKIEEKMSSREKLAKTGIPF